MSIKDYAQPEEERTEWLDLSAHGLARAYGDSEPEYSNADLKRREIDERLISAYAGQADALLEEVADFLWSDEVNRGCPEP